MSIVVLFSFSVFFKTFFNHLLIAKFMSIKTFHSRKRLSGYFLPFVFLAAFFIPSLAFAQATTVTGKVTGSDGAPVAGVTVQEKGLQGNSN